MELIKVEWAQGGDMLVSFSAILNSWLISDGEDVFSCPLDSQDPGEERGVAAMWRKCLQECSDRALLR